MKSHLHLHLCVALSLGFSSLLRIRGETEIPKELSDSTLNFTLELLKEASSSGEKNVVFSPASIMILLAAIREGASGETGHQLSALLGSNTDGAFFSPLVRYFQDAVETNVLRWGNRMYLQKGFNVSSTYLSRVKTIYNVTAEEVNFSGGSGAKAIAHWLQLITAGEASTLFSPASVSSDTILLLVSAIYFSSRWRHAFQSQRTYDKQFHFGDGAYAIVPFMIKRNKEIEFGRSEELGAKWIQLHYSKNTSLSMLLVVPTERFRLNELLTKMTYNHVIHMMEDVKKNVGTILVPKFKLSSRMAMPIHLKGLGVWDIFTERANLEGITSQKPFHVSDMIHECRMDVDEKGTTAAAMTTANFQFLSGPFEYGENAMFQADEPFLFIVFDSSNKIPIFAGKVTNPQTS